MSKPTTYVLLIVDMSGSMNKLADDVRGGFNAYVDELRADTDREYRLSVTLFDTEFIPLCTAHSLDGAPAMTEANYRPRGSTALMDAVGLTIGQFESAAALDEDDRVLVVVQTDGRENSSREFTAADITHLIKTREAGGRWSFVFLGAGPNTWRQAEGMGFQIGSTVALDASEQATKGSYFGLATATRSYSRGGSAADSAATVAAASGGRVPSGSDSGAGY
ncbi:hypothetical protein OOJ91_12050 [Micromonospora lupini]|uniref:hypothetical protein n=1 Tax=Micromonospora lupini TaxID=285679 RepID=UPI00224DDEA0|nr:hypothetical protein [Micromonospora lupini]MCX5066610.1 hypothetical protein [Micromonospora lupini]